MTLNLLYIFNPTNLKTLTTYELHGTCADITRVGSTLYLGCSYNKINYVVEMWIQGAEVEVNRYYDDTMLEGVRKVEPLGFDKVALLGDDEVMVVGEGVNQNILLEMERNQI